MIETMFMPSSKTKSCRKTELRTNVPFVSSNHCASFQFKRSNCKVTECQKTFPECRTHISRQCLRASIHTRGAALSYGLCKTRLSVDAQNNQVLSNRWMDGRIICRYSAEAFI